jgi:radical SAM family uncharacterized protein
MPPEIERRTVRNLADIISKKLLPRVRQPGQYIGLEINARQKLEQARPDVSVALAFPDTYTVGISHLGSQVLYQVLNDTPGVACDRTYCPTVEAEQVMRAEGIGLFGWESRCHIRDFDIVGFSLGYEICITNVLTMLDLAGIALHANERTEQDPIIVGGDALADSPEPIADFFDLFICGDGEKPLKELALLVTAMKKQGATRQQIILQAARTIESAYSPLMCHETYGPDGAFAGLAPNLGDPVRRVLRSHVPLTDSPAITAPLVPLSEGVHERVVVEVMRGCPNACRFCQAGATRLPVRVRKIDEILDIARRAIDATGFSEISLLSLSTSDYPNLEELLDRLNAEFAPRRVSISLPSLRVGLQLRLLPKLTSQVRKGGLTIAAEAGSQRLRQAIGKDISDQDMLEGVKAAFTAGWRSVKVYFMAGLPGETPEDIDAIYELCRKLSYIRKEVDGQRGSITGSVSWFVPKPHTPMQWTAMQGEEYFWSVRNRLRDLSYRTPITFRFHRIERSLLEGLLCRGDRRVGKVIELAWRAGARMDSWDEHFDYAIWKKAMADAGIDLDLYLREIQPGQPLPWGHIACFRSEEFLAEQYDKMRQALK